jgi:hypothetical protein
MKSKPSEHYMRLEPKEMRHKQQCGCRLVRDEDTGAVSLFQCPAHDQAVEVWDVAKQLQKYLDAVAGMSARVKEESGKLLTQAEKLLGRV